MIGLGECAPITRTTSSVNAPACVEVPISMVGCTRATTSASPGGPFRDHAATSAAGRA